MSSLRKSRLLATCGMLAALVLSGTALPAEDLKDAATPDSYLALYRRHNPERDYQKQYYEDVFQAVEQSQIFEKVLHVIQSRLSGGDAEQFDQIRTELTEAVSVIEWSKVTDCSEMLYTQRMPVGEGQIPASQHLLIIRIPDGGASSLRDGIANLFQWASDKANGRLPVTKLTLGDFQVTRLQLPPQSPFQPMVGASDDLFLFGTNEEYCRMAVTQLADPSMQSRFEDERCANALQHLPAAEDAVTFFDGKLLFSEFKKIGSFIRSVSQGDPEAARIATLFERVSSQIACFDYEVAVEYTEGYQNRMDSYGAFLPDADSTVLGQMVLHQTPFESWGSLVPDSTNGFSIGEGINLHPLYVWLMEEIPAVFPEAQSGLDRFAAIQDSIDLHLDEDILQSFSGEYASISLPGAVSPFGQANKSVLMLKCSNPDRIRELIHRGMNSLEEIPQLKAYGVGVREVPGMEDFDEITMTFFAMAGINPIIGSKDGWMILGTSRDAVATVLSVKESTSESFAHSERFAKFNLPIEGPVKSVSYVNNAEQTRALAAGLQQAGIIAPMVLGMMGQANGNQPAPDLTAIQDVMALLPPIGRIIGKLDFIEETMKVTQSGEEPGTYHSRAVITIRPPAPEAIVE
ncbi:MAG: hypothetical protein KDA96_18110 [Planctomycetaceae bacterium]|nr:hypothetical protein [Planctomycetaceae bacterium]